MNWNRIFSGLVVLTYFVLVWHVTNIEVAFRILLYCVFPITCIWFSQAMADYIGPLGGGIDARSPAWEVCILGWLLLLMPVIAGLIFLEESR